MTATPLIARLALAKDWTEAFRILWPASFAKAATNPGLAAGDSAIDTDDLVAWPQRRHLCLSLARRCAEEDGDDELACAWTMLGAAPRRPGWRTGNGDKTYMPVLQSLAGAILADAALLDDAAFVDAVDGWRCLERAGSDGEDDLIVAAQRYGAMAKIDKDRLLPWAHAWAGAR
jgi:hypothetical protein